MCVCVKWYTTQLQKKKNKILPFATTWIDLEDIMLSELSQKKTSIKYHSYVESK